MLERISDTSIEIVRGTHHVSHSSKDPDHRITGSLAEAFPNGSLALVANSVERHTVGRKIALFLSQPPSVVREIWKQEEARNSDDEGDHTLEDEEPLPSRDASNVAQSMEDASSDQSSKCGGEDVTRVEDGDACSDLLASVEG